MCGSQGAEVCAFAGRGQNSWEPNGNRLTGVGCADTPCLSPVTALVTHFNQRIAANRLFSDRRMGRQNFSQLRRKDLKYLKYRHVLLWRSRCLLLNGHSDNDS